MPVWNRTAKVKYAQKGFEKAGLIPFNSRECNLSAVNKNVADSINMGKQNN